MWKDQEKFTEIVKFLRKLDGRKGSFIEEYACRVEYLVALNIEMQLEKDCPTSACVIQIGVLD